MAIAVDAEVRALCSANAVSGAVDVAIRAHGGEIMHLLISRSRDAELASEAYATFAEDVLRGMPRFEFRSSVRTWLYTLAHHALARVAKARGRRGAREQALDTDPSGSGPMAVVRSETPVYQQTETKLRLRALRERLCDEEQWLIELRTRDPAWRDIARIMIEDAAVDDVEIEREAVRLRKRFQKATSKLRRMAIEEGLLRPGEDEG